MRLMIDGVFGLRQPSRPRDRREPAWTVGRAQKVVAHSAGVGCHRSRGRAVVLFLIFEQDASAAAWARPGVSASRSRDNKRRGEAARRTANSMRTSTSNTPASPFGSQSLGHWLRVRRAAVRSPARSGKRLLAVLAPRNPLWQFPARPPGPPWRRARSCCRSSVVEHPLGKGEVVSSILTGSTSSFTSSWPLPLRRRRVARFRRARQPRPAPSAD